MESAHAARLFVLAVALQSHSVTGGGAFGNQLLADSCPKVLQLKLAWRIRYCLLWSTGLNVIDGPEVAGA